MSKNPLATLQSNSLTDALPAIQVHLQSFLAENEEKVAQARAQLAHVDALLASLKATSSKTRSDRRGISGRSYPKTLKNKKRPSLFGSDKDKIIIGKKFDEPLIEFQDFV